MDLKSGHEGFITTIVNGTKSLPVTDFKFELIT